MKSNKTPSKLSQRIHRRAPNPMALEQRFMFDGAAVGTAVDTLVDKPVPSATETAIEPSVQSSLQEAALQVEVVSKDPANTDKDTSNTSGSNDDTSQTEVVKGLETLSDTARLQWQLSQAQTGSVLSGLAQQVNFDALMRDVFGRAGTAAATFDANLAALKADLQAGKLSVPIEMRTDADMQGLMAAYAAVGPDGKERIYVNAAWLQFGAGSSWITQVMLEEYGHAIDQRLNGLRDSPGDEGELFAAQMLGLNLDVEQNLRMRTESDFAYLQIDGATVEVQHASFNFTNAYAIYTGAVGGNTFLADKEQNRHNFTYTPLSVASIADGSNGINFSGNDVSVDLVIGGTHYYGWISRPIKDGGVVKGFYFWKDAQFTTLALAQADGNADGDGNAADNSGFILVVDQSYFTNLAFASGGGTTYKFVNSSSDRVDSALNSLVTSNAAPVAVADVSDLNLSAGASGGPAQEQGYSVATVNATGNVLTNDTDADTSDSKNVAKVGTSSASLVVAASTTSANGTSVTGSYGTLTIGADGTYVYVVDNSNAAVNALRTTSNTLSDVFAYTMKDGAGATSTTTLTVKIIGANDAPVAINDYNTAKEHTSPTDTGYNATGNVLTNDTDVDTGDTKTISVIKQIGDATAGTVVSTTTDSVVRFDAGSGFNANTVENKTLYISVSGTYRAVHGSSGALVTALNGGVTLVSGTTYDVKLSQDVYYYLDASNTQVSLTLAQLAGKSVGFKADTAETTLTNSMKTATLTTTASTGTYTVALTNYSGSIAVGAALWYDNDATSAINYVDSLLTVQSITYDANGLPTQVTLNGRIPFSTGTVVQFRSNLSVGTTYTGQYGTLNLASDGTYTYTPGTNISSINAGDTVVEVFDYTMQDTAGVTSSAKLYITVYGDGSNSPTLTADTGTAYEAGVGRSGSSPYGLSNDSTVFSGVAATGDVLSNDTKGTAGTTATVTNYSLSDGSGTVNAGSSLTGTYGALTILSTGGFTYTVSDSNTAVNALRPSQTLTETFWYTITNSSSITGKSKLVITIQGTNDVPVGVDDVGVANLVEDVLTITTGNVLVNDTDVDSGDSKTVSLVIAGIATPTTSVAAGSSMSSGGTSVDGTYGRLTIGADGSYSYTLGVTASQNNAVQALGTSNHPTDVFTYQLTDGYGATATAKLTFTIDGTGEPPVNNVNGNSFSNTSTLTYTTALNTALVFTGTKVLTVTDADSNLASVTLTVDNGTLSFTSGVSGATLSATSGSTITISGSQTDINTALALLQYTPNNNYSGNDYLTIASKDANNLWDIDGIAINVPSVYAGPTVLESDLSTGSTPAGTQETNGVTLTAPTNHTFGSSNQSGSGTYGTWTLNKTTGVFSYTLTSAPSVSGSSTTDSISIYSYDAYGNAVTNTVNVTINNDAPIARADARSVTEGTVAAPAANLIGNVLASGVTGDVADTKGADTPVTVTRVIAGNATPTTTVAVASTSASNGTTVGGSYGSLVIGANGSYVYDLDDNNSTVDALTTGGTLTDVFTYEITDSDGNTSTTTLTITINGTDDSAITVSSPTVNEASQYAVFSVGVTSGQNITLALGNGTATGGNTSPTDGSVDYSNAALMYSLNNGVNWTSYSGAFNATLSGGATALLVRTTVVNDSTPDNGETFTLTVTPNGGSAVVGTATIKDDGTGDIYNANGTTNDTTPKDDDRIFKINNIDVNEASSWGVFRVEGTAGQQLTLTLLQDSGAGGANGTGGAATLGTDTGYFDSANTISLQTYNGTTWVNYNANDVVSYPTGSAVLLVRVKIMNDGATSTGTWEGAETFKLAVQDVANQALRVVGTGTILDDGTGIIYRENGSENTTAVRDDDRPLKIDSIIVNEGSQNAVFTVTAPTGLPLTLALRDGSAEGSASLANPNGHNDYSTQIQYFDGNNWQNYDPANKPQIAANTSGVGTLYVRVAIANDTVKEGTETFNLLVTSNGSTASGECQIKDDGTGSYWIGDATQAATPAQLTAAGVVLDDDFDLDGIAPTTEEQLATLAASQGYGKVGDLNNDGKQDALQNAMATLAWVKVEDFQSALDGTLTSIKPIVSVGAMSQDNQGNWAADDTKYQLENIEVIKASSLDNGVGTVPATFNGAPLTAPWDPIRFAVTKVDAANQFVDTDINRPGTQVVIYIDIARTGLTTNDVNAYVKYVSQAAIAGANGQLFDLDGKAITSAGWYDFTQRKNNAGQYVGDGARFVLAADGVTIKGIQLTITDNAFGDNDPRVGYVFDPGMPVKISDLIPVAGSQRWMGDIELKHHERQDNWGSNWPREPVRFDSSLYPLNTLVPSGDLRLTEPLDDFRSERSTLSELARYFDVYAPQGDWRVSVIPAEREALTLFRGMPDQFAEMGQHNTLLVPWDAFMHTSAQAQVMLSAKLANGSELPAWVQLDAKAGKFVVQAPVGLRTELSITLTARDTQGREASTLFKLQVGQKGAGSTKDTGFDKPGRNSLSQKLRESSRERQAAASMRLEKATPA